MVMCSLVAVDRRFGRMYCLSLQGQNIACLLLAGVFFDLENGSSTFLQNVLTSTNGFTTEKKQCSI
jgi:hypothetical protein